MRYDPYDVRIAFDDLYEKYDCQYAYVYPIPNCAVGADLKHVTRNVLRRARGKRLNVPLKIEPAAADTTAETFRLSGYEVLGADLSGGREVEFPLYAAGLRYFQSAQPAPKLARLDTPRSYAQFRETRRARAGLDTRLRALEALVSQHVADRHSERLATLEDDFARHLVQHPDGFKFGDYPPESVLGVIPVVEKLRGKVECWQDGDEICCTVKFKNRGDLAFLTTGTPVQKHLEEALGATNVEEFEHVLPVLHRLAQVLGSTALIPQLCRTVSILSTTEKTSPTIGVMSAKSSPTLAAAMALLQRCQQGDRRAYTEACAMQECGAGDLLAEAGERLVQAQHDKAVFR